MKKSFLFSAFTLFLSLVFVGCDEPKDPIIESVNINNLVYRLDTDMMTAEVTGLGSSANRQLTIPSVVVYQNQQYNVNKVASYAFQFSDITSLTIPASVDYIGAYAIDGCMNLTSVKIEDSPNSLTWDKFQIAESLIEIPNIYVGRNLTGYIHTLPEELTLGTYVTSLSIDIKFYGPVTIRSYAATPPVLNVTGVPRFFSDSNVYVPSTSINAYRQAEIWKDFSNLNAF